MTNTIVKNAEQENLQAQISLARHIEAIANNVSGNKDVDIKNIRNTRKLEESRHHRNYMKEGGINE